MKQTETMTPEESLAVIQQMIDTSRRRFNQNGLYLILWGFLLIPAFVLTYLVEKEWVTLPLRYVWLGMVGIGAVASFIIGFRQGRRPSTKWTHLDAIFGFIWLTFIVGWLMIQFFTPMNGGWPLVIFLLAANAVLLSGVTIRFRPLIIGGVIMYLSVGVLFALLPNMPPEHLLIQAGALLAGYVIPGLMLYQFVKKTAS